MKIELTIEIDDEFVDEDHTMGITEEGFEAITEAVNAVGTIVDGPTKVSI